MSPSPHQRRIYLALGSNLGDREQLLKSACQCLTARFGQLRVSRFYETEPVGCPEGSPAFLNACLSFSSEAEPEDILKICQDIEYKLGRRRSGIYGESRSCDIDIIHIDGVQCSSETLTLPHPKAHLRDFVLRPLCELDPLLTLSSHTLNISQELQALN